ncbi:hypothetical protein C8Q74DRAFT_1459650 [Fomes fomentarius]|nr:hypothetical protein C8Q74DRAFT_1459650 [Fomes fomentarius]
MESRNPALYENGQYLLEWDPVEPNCLSQAARKAQADTRSPALNLPPVATNHHLHSFGFPYIYDFALRYAKRHHLTVEIDLEETWMFDGEDVFDFADIEDRHLADPDMREFFDLKRRCKMPLDQDSPFALEWDGIIALWSNYNIRERYQLCPDYDKVVEILREALNGEEKTSTLQWWFDWWYGVFRSVD